MALVTKSTGKQGERHYESEVSPNHRDLLGSPSVPPSMTRREFSSKRALCLLGSCPALIVWLRGGQIRRRPPLTPVAGWTRGRFLGATGLFLARNPAAVSSREGDVADVLAITVAPGKGSGR